MVRVDFAQGLAVVEISGEATVRQVFGGCALGGEVSTGIGMNTHEPKGIPTSVHDEVARINKRVAAELQRELSGIPADPRPPLELMEPSRTDLIAAFAFALHALIRNEHCSLDIAAIRAVNIAKTTVKLLDETT